MRWDLVPLVEQLTSVLHAKAEELELEQAVRGIDGALEVATQTLLADGLARHHRVTREAYYPSETGKRNHRARCDLVLTPKGMALVTTEAPQLFEETCEPEDAFWLELKVAHQLLPVSRRNPRYGAQWRSAIVQDLRKMKADRRIVHAALALVVFTDTQVTVDKDLGLFETLLEGEALLSGFRVVRTFAITDRIGHGFCSVAAWPLA